MLKITVHENATVDVNGLKGSEAARLKERFKRVWDRPLTFNVDDWSLSLYADDAAQAEAIGAYVYHVITNASDRFATETDWDPLTAATIRIVRLHWATDRREGAQPGRTRNPAPVG